MGLTSNTWPIIICGPPAPGFLLRNHRQKEHIIHMGGRVYPVDVLRQAAPKFDGLPVFSEHATNNLGPGEGNPRPYDPPDVGFIKFAVFNSQARQIQAMLEVTNDYWQDIFFESLRDGSLNKYGFSMTASVYDQDLVKLPGGGQMPLVEEILNIWSVDLVDLPYFGGGFMGVDTNQQWLDYSQRWKQKYMAASRNGK